jgi:hypothetical protein
MYYDRFEVTTRQYEADRAKAIRQHQLMTAAQWAQQAHQAPSPLQTWWTGLYRWVTSLYTRRGQAAQPVEDPSIS